MTRLVLSGFELDNIFVKLALLGIGLFFASYAVLFIIKACIHIFQGGKLAFHAYKDHKAEIENAINPLLKILINLIILLGVYAVVKAGIFLDKNQKDLQLKQYNTYSLLQWQELFATDQKEYEVNASMLANTQFFESELEAARTQAPGFSWEGFKNVGAELLLPFWGWYKEAKRELQPTTYKNLNKIREANSALLYTNINHMAPHEFQKWLNERKQEHFANGGNASTWLDLLEKTYDTPSSGWGYFEMGADCVALFIILIFFARTLISRKKIKSANIFVVLILCLNMSACTTEYALTNGNVHVAYTAPIPNQCQEIAILSTDRLYMPDCVNRLRKIAGALGADYVQITDWNQVWTGIFWGILGVNRMHMKASAYSCQMSQQNDF